MSASSDCSFSTLAFSASTAAIALSFCSGLLHLRHALRRRAASCSAFSAAICSCAAALACSACASSRLDLRQLRPAAAASAACARLAAGGLHALLGGGRRLRARLLECGLGLRLGAGLVALELLSERGQAVVLLGRHAPPNVLELGVADRLLAPGASLLGGVHVGFERLTGRRLE